MVGNVGQTSMLGYDLDGNEKWFAGELPKGYSASRPEIKQPELPKVRPVDIPAPVEKAKRGRPKAKDAPAVMDPPKVA